MKNYRSQVLDCCYNCPNIIEQNTPIGTHYLCKVLGEEINPIGICDDYGIEKDIKE
jgi:hypothetical protein